MAASPTPNRQPDRGAAKRVSLDRQYLTVTGAYWAFTLTDGALRMVVLLHFHELGYSPLEVAMLFVLYELAGIVTNLVGGWWGARSGLRSLLLAGLELQVVALIALSAVAPGWVAWLSVAYVMGVQSLSGVAKDLVKTGAKSATKFVDSEAGLFRVVAVLTGSKNALKGVGFFVGAVLLGWVGYRGALWILAAVIVPALVAVWVGFGADAGRASQRRPLRSVLSPSAAVNRLSLARFFLFASRDIWFVVALPVFLSDHGWAHQAIGGFLAAWVVGYGLVQAATPSLMRFDDPASSAGRLARRWALVLALVCAGLGSVVAARWWPVAAVVIGLLIFGVVFAINSALHSYLIVELASADGTSAEVGFYYSANAAGRLAGTLLSGLLATFGGLGLALAGSAAFALMAWFLTAD